MSKKPRPSIIGDLQLLGAQAEVIRSSHEASAEAPSPTPSRRARADIVHTSLYVPKEAYRKLREIALTEECKVHDLLLEGINAVLEKRGHAALARKKQ